MQSNEEAVRVLEILAPTIKDHRQFEMKLASAPPELRPVIYEVCAPRLSFTAKPLDWYRMKAAQRAEQEQLVTLDGKGEIREFKSSQDASTLREAEQSLAASLAKRRLTLICRSCLAEKHFYAVGEENSRTVINKALAEGWIYDYKADPVRELCPACANA